MRISIAQTGVIFFIAACAFGVEEADVKTLVSESISISSQYEKVDEQLRSIRNKIRWLQQPPFDDKQIRGIKNNITFASNQINRHEALIELAKVTDPAERAKLAEEYETERKRLLAEEREAGKPFRKRIDKLKQEVKDKEAAFDKAMKLYCFYPQDKYPNVAGKTASAQYYNGFITCNWLDADGKQLAWAHITLGDKPFIKDNAEMLDGTYYISDLWPGNITVWAGNFQVHFVTAKPEWRGREKIGEMVKDFVDIEGLARIDATLTDNHLNDLATGSLASSKRYRIIKNEQGDATSHITDERVKVKTLKSRLRKPPVDDEQLKKDRELIEFYKEEIKQSEARLEVGTVTDPNERTAKIAKLEVEKNKLYAEKRKITKPYKERTRELKSGLKEKQAALNQAIKKYLLTGGDSYEGVDEITTKTSFYRGRINCSWEDADDNELCFAQLNLGDRPDVPGDALMLDGIYYISNSGSNFIWVWVDNFQVYFEVKKKQWQEKEKIESALKHFIDIDGLAKII